MTTRIMFITGKYPPQECGIGDYAQRLAQKLISSRYQLFILTSALRGSQNGIDESQKNGIEIIRALTQWDFKDYRVIINEILRNKIALINIQFHTSFFNYHPMVALLPFFIRLRRETNKIKLVVTVHELAGPVTWFSPGPLRRLWLLPLIFWADAVILINERDFFLLRKIPFFSRKIHYVPLASNIEVCKDIDRRAVRKSLGINDDEFLILRFGFVNNLRANFVLDLIHAVYMLCNKGHKIRLILVGGADPKDRDTVLSTVNSLGIKDRVILTGYRSAEEVSQYLQSADIAVQLNPDGVFRNTTLLATMSHGLPTIGLKKGHVPAVFVDRKNILLIPKTSPEYIVRAVEESILDRPLQERLRRESAAAVRGFNWGTVYKKTEQVYASLFLNSQKAE